MAGQFIDPTPLDWLSLDSVTTFSLDERGRILRENDPDRSPGPRLFIAACPEGVVAHVRHDVDEQVAGHLIALATAQPDWTFSIPACLPAILERLSGDGSAPAARHALLWRMPHGLEAPVSAFIISSDTTEGDELLARLAREGMPTALSDAGFVSLADFWAPWCVALEGGEIAAMAFAARLSDAGAAIGVYTFAGFRGRGLAAAVSAAWSRHPALQDLPLFYSALVANTSSHRVTERLDLPRIGVSVRII